MGIKFDLNLAHNYKNSSQIARVLTESWVEKNFYCPGCGFSQIEKYRNNKPVADFFCPDCKRDFELKSKKSSIGFSIADGAYETMIERINSKLNPDFLFLAYSACDYVVNNFFIVPIDVTGFRCWYYRYCFESVK